MSRRKGFTLIEMLIVLAIIVIITTVVLVGRDSFNKSLLIANAAYDVALTIRSAESYGVGGRVSGLSVSAGYGIDVAKGAPTLLTLFADSYPAPSSSSCHPSVDTTTPDAKPGDCVYEPNQGESVQTYSLGDGITISDFCALRGASWSCASSGDTALSSLDIVFARPNPTPYITVNGSYNPGFPVTAACLALTSPNGGFRYVTVASSGQIGATATSCP